MNYFEFYKIAPAFHINISELRKRYYEKSRASHPDSIPADKAGEFDADFLSALNNQAYHTLLHPLSRLKYILETEFSATDQETLKDDAAFLLEMMNLHEFLQEAILCEDEVLISKGRERLGAFDTLAHEEVSPFLALFDQGHRSPEIRKALQVYYNKLKYFTRLGETMGGDR
ncbi:MAG: hypothetical protein IPM92_02525 [Saprospiraceae bacterium]|nr:hypothetical protein [Saprospiraceae bacterium]